MQDETRQPALDSAHVSPVLPLLGLCTVHSGGLIGLNFQRIAVEVSSRRGPSFFQLAGLAETAVREARIRIGSALSRLGITVDEYALTVNLAPANVRKSGSGLDLAIAMAVLGAVGHIDEANDSDSVFFGELGLDGSVRGIPGVLPLLQGAGKDGLSRAFVPRANAAEAASLEGMQIHAVSHIEELIDHLSGRKPIAPLAVAEFSPEAASDLDLMDVRGQEAAKRALVVAAAGHHHLLFMGPPGSGKSLLARRMPGLLPPFTSTEALATTAIHSVAGLLGPARGIVASPPFRSPHHSVSAAGLVGGGSIPRPGELSLAHNGVLFLDELPEFHRGALEALRQPLEDHVVHLVRAQFRADYPAQPLVLAAMNPCPCGNFKSQHGICRCTPAARKRYLSRISGPLLDRLDLHVVVPPADLRSWSAPHTRQGLTTNEARNIVLAARQLQLERFQAGKVGVKRNSLLGLREIETVARPDEAGERLLAAAIDKGLLSARGYVRVLRVARTLADLDGAELLGSPHVGEALRYRLSDLSEI